MGMQQVGSASDVQNVNPLSDPFWGQLSAQMSGLQGQAAGYSPTNMLQQGAAATGDINSIVASLMGPYAGAQNALALTQAEQATRGMAGQYAGMNALQSGAALSAISRGAAEPFAAAATNLGQMQAGLGSGVLDQFFQNYNQQQQLNTQMQLGVLGAQAGLAQQEWWQPTYVQSPWASIIGQGLGTAGGLLALGLGGGGGSALGAASTTGSTAGGIA